MEKVCVTIPSYKRHCAQIVTGFHLLAQKNPSLNIRFLDMQASDENRYRDLMCVFAEYKGKRIVYDTCDGYLSAAEMVPLLESCDFYFKRSYSQQYNQEHFGEFADKIFPLGFNYDVTYRGNPMDRPAGQVRSAKDRVRRLLGKATRDYFTAEVFEGRLCPEMQVNHPKILFLTRLWDLEYAENGVKLSAPVAEEREAINGMRIDIIRRLRQLYGKNFVGGLFDNAVARKYAPDLICPSKYTDRRHYIRRLHRMDICVGSMGLHKSIGWKTGEYVAAGKAIVNEKFRYAVPGDFREGENYYSFSTAEECIDAVACLVSDPERLWNMKKANVKYYREYLAPDQLVANTLKIVSDSMTGVTG